MGCWLRALRVPTMPVEDLTPPRVESTTPSTETSSGSVLTKSQRRSDSPEASASTSVSVPQPAAGLETGYRRLGLHTDNRSDTGRGVSGGPACSSSGAHNKKDLENDSELVALRARRRPAVEAPLSESW